MPLLMSPTIGKLAEALASAQAEMQPAKKNATNPHFRSTYADLASCYEASRPAMAKHGLSIVQLPGRREDGTTTLTTMLLHTSGEFLGEEAGVKLSQETAQAAGSAITYLRRYAYSAMLGLATEDDDGAAAMPAQRPQSEARTYEQRPQEPRAAAPAPAAQGGHDPACPTCGGKMWDNREKKRAGEMSAKAPDFKCRLKECGGVIWPPRSSSKVKPEAPAPAEPYRTDADGNGEIPF